MIFGSFSHGSPTAEGFCRREVKVIGGAGNKAMNDRRKRMELRRMKSLTRAKSSEDRCVVGLKSKRMKTGNTVSEVAKFTDAVALVDDQLTENGVVAGEIDGSEVLSRTVMCESHGSISVIGRRREMEDAVAVELGFLARGGKKYDFFGVYDGHGGCRVAQACRETLHKLVAKIVGEEVGEEINWGKVMAAGFGKMDEEVNKNGSAVATMGSTAVVAVVGREEVVIANCGDSRAVLDRGGVAVQLSDDHKPDRLDELARIEVLGGKVINWNGQRVLGVLSTSRSIGDHYLKPYVITEPEVKVIKTTDSDEFLILASDGLWDVISNDLACQITRKCLNGQIKRRVVEETKMGGSRRAVEAAAVLAELAMARGSRDNISVIVVELKPSFRG